MKNLPRKLLSEIENSYKEVTKEDYTAWIDELSAYTKEHLTTKKLAQYMLGYL